MWGGGGGYRPDGDFLKSSAYFTVNRGGPMVLLQTKKTMFSQGSRRGPTFSKGGGGPTFSRVGCPNANFYRKPYTL